MNTPEIQHYQYLWDGTQAGWVLIRRNGYDVELSLKFDLAGPSSREMMAVRHVLPEFKNQALHQVIARLRGSQSFKLGKFDSKEAHRLAAACNKEGLNLVQEVINAPRFLPVNEIRNTALLIEDDELAQRIYETALLHGISVKQLEA